MVSGTANAPITARTLELPSIAVAASVARAARELPTPLPSGPPVIVSRPTMAITDNDVRHVAKLARLALSPSEVEAMTRDLGKILGYVDELAQVDTEGVPPTTYVAVERLPLRPDAAEAGVPQQTALSQAPRTASDGFAVPAFVDEG